MKSKLIRVISLVLVLGMLSSVALISCGQPSDGTETKKEADSSASETATGDTGSDMFPYLDTDVQKQDYSGVNNGVFTILYQGPNDPLYSHEIYIKDFDQADKIDSAIYRRNSMTEVYFNIKFNFEGASGSAHGLEVMKKAQAAVDSGDNVYQVVVNSHGGDYTPPAMERGYFMNLKSIPNLDLSKKYWAQFINDNAEVSGALFGVTGSISLVLYQELYVTFFNRKLCTDNSISQDKLFEAVNDGKWTLDYMINLTRKLYIDSDGNGVADTEDIYGYGLVLAPLDALWSSCNLNVVVKNANGRLELDETGLGRVGKVVITLNDFAWNSKGVLCLDNENEEHKTGDKVVYEGGGAQMIATDHVLFSNDRLGSVSYDVMKESKSGYGVLPYPKYSENQSQYYTGVRDHYTVFMVPFPARVMSDVCGAVLEYMAYASHNKVMPVYYEEVLTGRYIKDVQSIELLNIIFRNIKMEPGSIHGVGILALRLLRNLVGDNSDAVSSAFHDARNSAKNGCIRINNAYAKYASNDR